MLKTIWYGVFCHGSLWKGQHQWVLTSKSSLHGSPDEYRCKKCKRKRSW